MWFVGRSAENELNDDVGTHETNMVPKSECRSDMIVTADIKLEQDDDKRLHDLAVINS